MKATQRHRFVFGLIPGTLIVAAVCCQPPTLAEAGVYYWDSNGSTAGAGVAPNGTWGSNTFWNDSSTGSGGAFITSTGSGDSLYFVAGPAADSGAGAYSVIVSGTRAANSLTFRSSGAATLSDTGTVELSGGGITVSQYAYGITTQGGVTISAPLSLQASQTWTNNSTNDLTVGGSVTNGGNALTISGPGDTTISGAVSGSGSLAKSGTGTLTLTGTNTYNGGTSLNGGELVVASSGSVSSTSGNLYVGSLGPAAMTIQDNAAVSVGELDVNYQNTSGNASTLTLQSGTLTVSGQTFVGRAAMRTGPGTTSAALCQSGGTATLTGLLTVGHAGTAASLYDISSGTLDANGGLLVGRQGNGSATIHGTGIVNILGSGLVVGQDSSLTMSGSVSLAAGHLNIGTSMVSANLTLGSNGGLASFTRSGGTMFVKGDLQVGGIATLTLNGTSGSVATSFGHTLTRLSSGGAPAPGLLVIVPYTGDLGANESVRFGTAPSSTYGIIGPWLVAQASGADSSGTYLTYSGQLTSPTYASYSVPHTTVANELLNITGTATITDNGSHPWIVRVGPHTATLANIVTIGSGGLILNGGATSDSRITGGTVAFGNNQALIYAGSSNPAVTGGTIESVISGTGGLVKFGPGRLVLSGDNSQLTGGVVVGTGTLNIRDGAALGPGGAGNATIVAAGASLEIQGGVGVGNVSVTINGTGVGGGGALRNVEDENDMAGAISLGSDAQINTAADTMLTLAGAIQTNNFTLTKTGSGTLRLTGSSVNAFPGSVTVAGGTLALQSNDALGSGGGSISVSSGAALSIQGGVTIPTSNCKRF